MLINVRSLIKESWLLYKNNFKILIKIILWLFIPTVLTSILSGIKLKPVAALPINLFLWLVSLFIGFFVSIALILTINTLLKKEKIDLKTIYNLSYSKILSYLWVSILAGLVVFCGIILLVIPGIIFAVWFSFSIYLLILEGIKGTKALSASKNLVKGYFWPVLWRWFASYFVYGIILTLIIFIPIYIIGAILGNAGAGFAPVTPWWSALIANVIYAFTIPIFFALGVILYNSLKKEKMQQS